MTFGKRVTDPPYEWPSRLCIRSAYVSSLKQNPTVFRTYRKDSVNRSKPPYSDPCDGHIPCGISGYGTRSKGGRRRVDTRTNPGTVETVPWINGSSNFCDSSATSTTTRIRLVLCYRRNPNVYGTFCVFGNYLITRLRSRYRYVCW